MTTQNDIYRRLEGLRADADFQEAVHRIRPGRFHRHQNDTDYAARIQYTTSLRAFVYNPMVLNIIFCNEELKKLFFRTFGYPGALNFTIYPNCWLRDLPLLDIGKGAYLADGIVLGTNQVSTDQQFVTVGPITIGERSIFDQACMIGYHTVVGADCIIGIRCAIGIKCSIGDQTHIGEVVNIGHGSRIGRDVSIGQASVIGNFCVIEDGVEIPAQTRFPMYSKVTTEGVFHRRTGQPVSVF